MCGTCGCGDPEVVPVEVHESLLAGNEAQARHNRAHFASAGLTVINLMGAPGSGKTAVLEATSRMLGPGCRIAALAGDLATENDAQRLRRAGIPTLPITTGQACHLDAGMVHRGMHHLPWQGLDYLFIENVGNLVCPALYDLGQSANVVALSVTEGEDKPLKYPVMFKAADLVLVTKADLLRHLPDVSLDAISDSLARVMPRPQVIVVSSATGFGLDAWVAWLEARRSSGAQRVVAGLAAHGAGDPPR
jgi:hydrogenase nickel incorporation protein HypB